MRDEENPRDKRHRRALETMSTTMMMKNKAKEDINDVPNNHGVRKRSKQNEVPTKHKA